MMVGLRTASFAVLFSSSVALAGAVQCLLEGEEYIEQGKSGRIPNGGYFHRPSFCQSACSTNPFCDKWTWKEQGNWSHMIGNGGCWHFSSNASLESTGVAAGRVVSGPKVGESPDCPLEVAPNMTNGATPISNVSSTMLPTSAAPVATAAPVLPTLPPMPVTTEGNSTTNATIGAPEPASEGGFPWWGILLIIVGVVGIAAALMYLLGGGEGKGAKKKKKTKRSAKAPAEAAQPMVELEAPLEQVPLVEAAAPEFASSAPAAPVTTFSQQAYQPQMVAYTGMPQAMPYLQPQGVYAGMPARQLQVIA
mmetsp:Transcript_44892/g.138850  ORF Transcript_44892/g.138850 Transcript_44892/m.138850 type:complete len:307 (-) Transcript_44892:140-1060(-)